ncbi:MAG: MlaD family protein [Flavobacteriales bacterium]
MNTTDSKFKLRLGIFIAGGLILFVAAIFFIGKQKNLFDPAYTLSSTFYNVSGLQVGNNVRFTGINVGTVDNIKIINDSTVQVDMLIKKSVNQFIKTDCEVAIGSEGLIGDRILIITQGGSNSSIAEDGFYLRSVEPVETDAIMASLEVTAGNAEIITSQLAEIMVKINSGNGTLGRLIQDTTMAENFDQTMLNLKKSSKGLNENMDAAKDNILLRGYFKKKNKEAEKKKESDDKK